MKTRVSMVLIMAMAMPLHAATLIRLGFTATASGSALSDGWRDYRMSRHRPAATMRVVAIDGREALHIDARRDAGAVARTLDLPAATTLDWQWKVDHSVQSADISRTSGDDAAARVYVFFAVPRSQLSWFQRMKLDVAEHVLGHPMPTAALCYIWDNHHAVDSVATSPFFSGVRTIVLESGNRKAGAWQVEHRDLAADYRTAFGRKPPRISGIALAADTDNTHGQAQAWFSNVTLQPASP